MSTQNPKTSFSVPLAEPGGTPFPADVDITPAAERYVGFFENHYGEQLIYVHERDTDPVLYHGDDAWESIPAALPTYKRLDAPHDGATWMLGRLLLSDAEAVWLAGCLGASRAVDTDVAQAMAMELFNEEMAKFNALPAEQRDEMMRKVRTEAKKKRG